MEASKCEGAERWAACNLPYHPLALASSFCLWQQPRDNSPPPCPPVAPLRTRAPLHGSCGAPGTTLLPAHHCHYLCARMPAG